jgi:hypothetical protein
MSYHCETFDEFSRMPVINFEIGCFKTSNLAVWKAGRFAHTAKDVDTFPMEGTILLLQMHRRNPIFGRLDALDGIPWQNPATGKGIRQQLGLPDMYH